MKKSSRFLAWDPKSCTREERHAARVFWVGFALERLLVLANEVTEIERVLGEHHEVILNVERGSAAGLTTVPVEVTIVNPPQVSAVFAEILHGADFEVEFDDQELESLQAGRSGTYACWLYSVRDPQGLVPRNLAMIRGPGFEARGVTVLKEESGAPVKLSVGEKITLQIGPADLR